MRPVDAIPDAPVYTATLAEMQDLEELLARANEIAMQYGAVRIDPPSTWAQPPLRMHPKSRFFVRMQTLPAAPFADQQIVNQANAAKNHPRKRGRRNSTPCDEDSDQLDAQSRQQKTTARDRAARAASRSHRNHPNQSPEHNKQALLDYIANADFNSEGNPSRVSLETPLNPHCTPVPSPPPELRRAATKLPPSSTELASQSTQHRHAFGRPSSREPQAHPTPAPSGRTQAVREAALRLAEAFTGSAKADPAQNATAIPPCPFSQQTAQEHMAKRTVEDQPPLPVSKAISIKPPVPPTSIGGTMQPPTAQECIAAAVGNARGIVGEVIGYDARVHHGEVKANNTPHDAGGIVALEAKHKGVNVNVSAAPRKDEKECSKLAMEIYFEGKKQESLLHDDTRIPRITSQSNHPFSAPKRDPARPPWVVPRDMNNNAAKLLSKPFLQNPSNVQPPALTAAGPFGRRETPKKYQAANPPHIDVKQTGNGGSNPCVTEGQSQHYQLMGPSVRSIHGESRISPVPRPGRLPSLRSVPLQSYPIGAPKANLVVARCVSDARQGNLPLETNAPTPQRREPPQTRDVHLLSRTKPVFPPSASPRMLESLAEAKMAEKRSGAVPPSGTAPEKTAAAIEKKTDSEGGNSGCTTRVTLAVPPQEPLEMKHNNTYDDSGKREQRGLLLPAQSVVSPSNMSLDAGKNPNQSKETEPPTNGVTPSFETKEAREGMQSKISFKAHPASTMQNLVPLATSQALWRYQERSRSPLPPEGTVLSTAGQESGWNPCHDIVEQILAAATGSADIALEPSQPQENIENLKPTKVAIMRREIEHVAPSESPSHPNLMNRMHIRDSGRVMNPISAEVSRPREDQEQVSERETQTKDMSRTHESHVQTHLSHVANTTSLEGQRLHNGDTSNVLMEPMSTAEKADIAAAPKRTDADALWHQEVSHQSRHRASSETAEDIVLVSERRTGRDRKQLSRNRSKPEDIVDLDAEKPSSADPKQDVACSKCAGKRGTKRKVAFRNLQVDQDEAGRLTKAVVFPDSGTPISLAAYQKKAREHHDETSKALNTMEETGITTNAAENILVPNATPDFQGILDLSDVDTLEIEFWNAMTGGINGKPITVAYGVDVEAEGAFDSNEMSYVEWHGSRSTGSSIKKRRRGRPRIPQSVENTGKQPHTDACRTRPDELQEDADDEMNCNDGTFIHQSETRMPTEKHRSYLKGHKNKKLKSPLPRSHVGTLNRDGILRHMPRMPGINHSMYYVGQLFTRFCWHTEDAFLNSVSYLHPGSAEKVWYAVPPRFAQAFEEFAASDVFSPSLLDNESAGRVLLMNKTTMFDPRRVRRRGVEVYRVVHKPGSFVLTAPRAYHAGFNCGFNIAEAVNFANPTWFPVGREASIFGRQALRPLCVPWEYLLFHEAKSLRDVNHGVSIKVTPTPRLASNAQIVAKELKTIIMDGEQKIREYAEGSNSRVSMLHEITGLTKHNQLGPEFGNGAGMVCSLCFHACHFYAEMCASCDDSFEARCVDHFGKGHRLCLHDTHKTVIVRRHDPVMLLDILGCLERIAGIRVDAIEVAQRYVGYIRTWQTPVRTSGLRLRLDLKAATSRLPPKVSKEKGSKEKIVKAKVTRDKPHREKRRKIRKPAGMFAHAGDNKKRGVLEKAQVLGGIDVFTTFENTHEMESEQGRLCSGVTDVVLSRQ